MVGTKNHVGWDGGESIGADVLLVCMYCGGVTELMMQAGEVIEEGRVDRCCRPGKRWGKRISRYCGGGRAMDIEAARDK